MDRITTKYTIEKPTKIRIEGMVAAEDILCLHTILKNEGCLDSENKWLANDEKAIGLDQIQTRLSQKKHVSKQASADMLICITQNKYLLADAKFRQENVKNFKLKDLNPKLNCSKNIVLSDDFRFDNAFYVLLKKKILSETNKRYLKQQFKSSPLYRFVNAEEFWNLFH